MSNIKINDVFQRIQYLASSGQTQFSIPFPFFQNPYVYVWQDGVQIFQGAAPGQYGITGAGSPSGGQITLVTPALINSVITIEGIMPIDRTSIYSATISNLTGSDLNGDFNREVVMMKQIETTQVLLQLQYAPWALVSQDQSVTKDRYIPILPPLGAWRKNALDTEMEYFLTPDAPGLAPSNALYLVQTSDSNLPDAIALDEEATGFMVNVAGTGFAATRIFQAVANQLVIDDADGMGGNPLFGIADNPILPGTAGMGIPAGTTAERVTPTPPSIGMRFNTDLGQVEAYIDSAWVAIPSAAAGLFLPLAGGTMTGNIDMDGNFVTGLTDPNADDQATNKGYVDDQLDLKLSLSGGTMTGDIHMGDFIIDGLPLPTTDTEAASKIYVDNAVGGAAGGTQGNIQWNNGGAFAGDPDFNTDGAGNLTLVGSFEIDNLLVDGNRISPLTGLFEIESGQMVNNFDANTHLINNLGTCLVGTDAANKAYVDATAAGKYFVAPVRAAATTNFASTYSNGTAGVGATLTASVNGAAALDGVSLALNDRVLFSFQSSSFQNGIYTVTQVGSGGTPAIYTRATDYDQPTEIDPGDTIGVTQGTIYAGAFFMETAIVTTIGTDPITFVLSINPNVVTISTTQTITGDKTFTGTTTLDNFIFDTNQMQHAADTDNYFGFGTDTQNFVTGNSSRMDISNSGVRLGGANARVTTILDEDTMSSNSDTSLATQQSIKAYVDSYVGGGHIGKNIIIGGNFDTNPWQRQVTFAAASNGSYTADRWQYAFVSNTAVVTVSRQNDAPTAAQAGIFSSTCLQVAVTTADTSIAAGEYAVIQQIIEGYNWAQLAQNPCVLSFWVKFAQTGTFCVGLNNGAADRSFTQEFTVNAANTWEKKTILIPASPSAGTWDYTNGRGLYLGFVLAAGSTFQGTAGSWQTGNFIATSNQTNGLSANTNTFRFALIQLEAGSTATPFEIRSVNDEWELCKRYYQKTYPPGSYPSQGGGGNNYLMYRCQVAGVNGSGAQWEFETEMRAAPSMTYYSVASANSTWRNASSGADSGASGSGGNLSTKRVFVVNAQAAGDIVGANFYIQAQASAEL